MPPQTHSHKHSTSPLSTTVLETFLGCMIVVVTCLYSATVLVTCLGTIIVNVVCRGTPPDCDGQLTIERPRSVTGNVGVYVVCAVSIHS